MSVHSAQPKLLTIYTNFGTPKLAPLLDIPGSELVTPNHVTYLELLNFFNYDGSQWMGPRGGGELQMIRPSAAFKAANAFVS